ncbi:hypothetical protein B296_00015673, partial [Ensete ventricosum]
VTLDWPGLPAGVKFDPSDAELLEHLAGKTGLENSKLHILIDEFIPMLEEDEGICYTHPENLPGKEGSSDFYFSSFCKIQSYCFYDVKTRCSYIFLVMQDLQFGSQESIMSWLDRF